MGEGARREVVQAGPLRRRAPQQLPGRAAAHRPQARRGTDHAQGEEAAPRRPGGGGIFTGVFGRQAPAAGGTAGDVIIPSFFRDSDPDGVSLRPSMRRLAISIVTIALLSCATVAHAAPATAPLAPPHATPAQRGQSLLGLLAFTLLAYLIGKARGAKRFPWRVVVWGTVLDFAFGAIVLF